jgi:hypothetical protein
MQEFFLNLQILKIVCSQNHSISFFYRFFELLSLVDKIQYNTKENALFHTWHVTDKRRADQNALHMSLNRTDTNKLKKKDYPILFIVTVSSKFENQVKFISSFYKI